MPNRTSDADGRPGGRGAQTSWLGYEPSTVEAHANFYGALYRTFAERAGMDPFELYQRRHPTIVREVVSSVEEPMTGAQEFSQPEGRGYIRFDPKTGKPTIVLGEAANLSTFIHESAHEYSRTDEAPLAPRSRQGSCKPTENRSRFFFRNLG